MILSDLEKWNARASFLRADLDLPNSDQVRVWGVFRRGEGGGGGAKPRHCILHIGVARFVSDSWVFFIRLQCNTYWNPSKLFSSWYPAETYRNSNQIKCITSLVGIKNANTALLLPNQNAWHDECIISLHTPLGVSCYLHYRWR